MKFKKILFTILVFLIGINGVAAACTKDSHYEKLKGIYKDLSALSYYHVIYNSTKSRADNANAFQKDASMRRLYNCAGDINSSCQALINISNLYHEEFLVYGILDMDSNGHGLAKRVFLKNELDLSSAQILDCLPLNSATGFYRELSSRLQPGGELDKRLNTVDVLWSEVDGIIYRVMKNINASANSDEEKVTEDEYESYKESIAVAYEDFCDYLNSHYGISEFIDTALNIVIYASLALGIFLGVLDFIKAISSQDDAALTKAFQTFIKRVAAIALIFLSGVIVTIVINFVSIPGVNRDATICRQFDLGRADN